MLFSSHEVAIEQDNQLKSSPVQGKVNHELKKFNTVNIDLQINQASIDSPQNKDAEWFYELQHVKPQ